MGMCFIDGGHNNHCTEMFRFKDYNLVIIILVLFMICSSTKEVCLLIGSFGFVMESKVILH